MKPQIRLMVDSGAYSSWTQNKPISLSEYTEFVIKNHDVIDTVVNLDVIAPGNPEVAAAAGRENFLKMRDAGVITLPVYHAREGLKWLDLMLDDCPYIGLSATSLVSPTEQRSFLDICWHYCTSSNGFPIAKFHAFGDTAPLSMLTYPWHSVSKDSLLLIKQAGRIRVESIEELFWSSPAPVEFLTKSHSSKRRELHDIETLVPINGECLWMPVKSVLRHETSKSLFEVRTRRGKKVRLTDDHGLFVSQGADDLNGIPTPTPQLVVRKSNIVSPQPSNGSLSFGLPELKSMIFNIPISSWRIGEGKNVTYEKIIPYKVGFDIQLMEYLGLWLADGSFGSDGDISISAANDLECRALLQSMADKYDRKLTIDSNGVDSGISSVLLFEIVHNLFGKEVRYESSTKEIPWWVYQLPTQLLGAFLRGYFSGDGSAESDSVSMSSASPKLRHAIYFLLTGLGMRCICSEETGIRTAKFSNGKTYNCKPAYKLQVLDKESLKIFREKVGFLQTRKNEILSRVIAKKKEPSDIKSNGKRCGKINIRDLKVKEVELVRVEEIKEVKEKPRYVYDISVPGVERFVANGLVVHNSADSATWMISGCRAGSVKLQGKTYRLRSKVVSDTNYISDSDIGPQKDAWQSEFRMLGLDPDAVMSVVTTPSQLAMIRSFLVAADMLKLQEMTRKVTRFKKPSALVINKRQETGGTERVGPVNMFFVISPSAAIMNFPVIATLGIKDILVSYFYVAKEKPIFWEEKLKPFLYDPIGYIKSNEKMHRFYDKLQEVLLKKEVTVIA